MYKRLVLLFFVFSFFTSYAQVKEKDSLSILIYYEGQGFLQPFIETTIKKLNNVEASESYFSSVNSFNRFISDNKYQAELNNLYTTQKSENDKFHLYYSDAEKEAREKIVKIISDYDFFLTVKTNTLGELIEFQFQLFSTINSSNISDKLIGVENFFINPKDSEYLNDIKNGILRLFKGSNQMPIARLKVYKQDVKNNDTILVPMSTPILLDGSSSYDFDTEQISYTWKNIPKPNENFQTFEKIDLITNASQQNITINKPGIYLIRFIVNDEILESKAINFYLKTINRKDAVIVLDSQKTDYTYSYASIKYPEPVTKGELSYKIKKRKNDSLQILITNKEIGNKYVKSIDEKYKIEYKVLDSTPVDSKELIENISFESDFPNFPSDSINYFYLYNMDKDSILSEHTLLKHRYIHRKAGTFSIVASSTIVNGFNVNSISTGSDSLIDNNSSFALILEGAVALTPRIELGGSFPIYSSGRINTNEYSLKPHSSLTLFTNYYLIPKGSSFLEVFIGIGGGLSNYEYKNREDSFDIVYLQEARFGYQMELTFLKNFSMTYGSRVIIGRYNKSLFKNLYYTDLGFFIKFRI